MHKNLSDNANHSQYQPFVSILLELAKPNPAFIDATFLALYGWPKLFDPEKLFMP